MTLQAGTVKDGASALTPTGGSDMSFTPDGQTVANGIHLANAAQTDFRVRENLTFKSKVPSLNAATGVYSKGKQSLTYVEPKILADGSTVFNLIRIEVEVHPEATAAEALNLRMMGGQFISDADYNAFWTTGSLA